MSKYYVVWRGRKPGVYSNWASAFEQVHEFSGARYKGYKDRDEAYAAYGNSPAPVSNLAAQDKSLNRGSKSVTAVVQGNADKSLPTKSLEGIKESPYQPGNIEMPVLSNIEGMRIYLARFCEKIAQDKARRRRERGE